MLIVLNRSLIGIAQAMSPFFHEPVLPGRESGTADFGRLPGDPEEARSCVAGMSKRTHLATIR